MTGGDAASRAVSYGLLLLLALQYGLQPFLTSRFVSGAGCDSRAVVLLTELVKAALCAASLAASRRTPARRAATPARGGELWRAAAPAACYVVQNLALQRAYADLDSLTFNCLNQLKLVATAACLYLLLRQRQTPQQLGALAMLVAAALLLQLAGEQRAARSVGTVHSFRRGVVVRAPAADTHGHTCDFVRLAGVSGGVRAVRPRVRALADSATGTACARGRPPARSDAWHRRKQHGSMSSAAFTLQMVRPRSAQHTHRSRLLARGAARRSRCSPCPCCWPRWCGPLAAYAMRG